MEQITAPLPPQPLIYILICKSMFVGIHNSGILEYFRQIRGIPDLQLPQG